MFVTRSLPHPERISASIFHRRGLRMFRFGPFRWVLITKHKTTTRALMKRMQQHVIYAGDDSCMASDAMWFFSTRQITRLTHTHTTHNAICIFITCPAPSISMDHQAGRRSLL